MFLRCMRLVVPGLHLLTLSTMVVHGASSWYGPLKMYQMIQSSSSNAYKASYSFLYILYLDYDALLDMTY